MILEILAEVIFSAKEVRVRKIEERKVLRKVVLVILVSYVNTQDWD